MEVISEPWAKTVAGSDPRFADAMRWHGQPEVPLDLRREYRVLSEVGRRRKNISVRPSHRGFPSTLVAEITGIENLTRVEDRLVRTRELQSAIQACRAEAKRMSAFQLEDALMDYFAAVTAWAQPRLDALRMRLGLNADGPSSLEDAGRLLGVSRERIRQLMQLLQQKLPDHPVFMPQLDAALKAFAEAMPLAHDATVQLLADRGIAQGPIHPEALAAVATLCGRTFAIRTTKLTGGYVVVSTESMSALVPVARVAWSQAMGSGASSIHEVSEQLAAEGMTVEPGDVQRYLRAHPAIEFLTDDWFWAAAAPSNRLCHLTRKMLAMHEPQTVQCLRGGMHRSFRYRKSAGAKAWPRFVPPPSILLQFFRQHPDFRVGARHLVYSTRRIDPKSVLSSTEKLVADAIQGFAEEIPGRQALLHIVTETGINKNTVAAVAAFSCILESPDRKCRILRGTGHVAGASYERNQSRPKPQRTIGYRWLENDRLLIAYRLPGFTTDPAVSIPAPVFDFLRGRTFTAYSEDDLEVGTVTVHESNGGHILGYGDFLDRSGGCEGALAEEGDILMASFDLDRGSVTLRVKFLDIPDYE